MAEKYTPGLWKIGKQKSVIISEITPERSPDDHYISDPESDRLNRKYYGGHLICESILKPADANLISAAPELKNCLELMVGRFRSQMWNDQLQSCYKALAKAEGRGE